jgi:hypothetical protein
MDKMKGLVTPNTVQINGKTQMIKTNVAKKVQKSEQKKKVEITKEFDQIPQKKVEDAVEKSHPKESNSTIKKEIIHSDKNLMI